MHFNTSAYPSSAYRLFRVSYTAHPFTYKLLKLYEHKNLKLLQLLQEIVVGWHSPWGRVVEEDGQNEHPQFVQFYYNFHASLVLYNSQLLFSSSNGYYLCCTHRHWWRRRRIVTTRRVLLHGGGKDVNAMNPDRSNFVVFACRSLIFIIVSLVESFPCRATIIIIAHFHLSLCRVQDFTFPQDTD